MITEQLEQPLFTAYEDCRSEGTADAQSSAADIPSKELLDCSRIMSEKKVYRFFKRFQDIVLSSLALAVLAVPLLIVALVIYIDNPKGSPIFVQKRVGLNGKVFSFYKFRSMCIDAESQLPELINKNEKDGPVFKIKDDPRITKVGRFIRKTSIDELPQLVNIIRGEMSIVGPRPPLPREVEQYDDYQRQRLYVRPGLTCIWQVQPYRDSISFDEWMGLDVQYIKERSFLLDWKLILLTIKCILGGYGQ